MTTARSVKINFQDESRDVALPHPATLTGLQDAVASTFEVELPLRSSVPAGAGDLSFTYRDPDGDDIVFDRDSELSLALRLCPDSLEISAAVADEQKVPGKATDDIGRLYHVAARNLREYNGVPSMTPAMLIKALAALKLSPRRLVRQSLAPAKLLKKPRSSSSDMDSSSSGGSVDMTEYEVGYVGAFGEHKERHMTMSVGQDAEKEWNDGFVAAVGAATPGVYYVETVASPGEEKVPASEDDAAFSSSFSFSSSSTSSSCSSSDDDNEDKGRRVKNEPLVGIKNVVHAALTAADIQIKPRETKPLFRALDVHPKRLVCLGLVSDKELHAAQKHDARFGREGRMSVFDPSYPTNSGVDIGTSPYHGWGTDGRPHGSSRRPSRARAATQHGMNHRTPPPPQPHWACIPCNSPGAWCAMHGGGPPPTSDSAWVKWGGGMPPWVRSCMPPCEDPPCRHCGRGGEHQRGSFMG